MLVVVLLAAFASAMLLLLLWMAVTPFAHGLTDETMIPLFSKQIDWQAQSISLKRDHLRQRYTDQSIGFITKEMVHGDEVSIIKQQKTSILVIELVFNPENYAHTSPSSHLLSGGTGSTIST